MGKTWGMVSFILFILGLVLAVIGGFTAPANPIVSAVLVIVGIIIGVSHIKDKEISTLLLATIALLAMPAAFSSITALGLGQAVTSVLVNFAALVSPVALIAAGKALINIGLQK
ncbi:MAG: hypothetical protein HYU85_04330 [Chloroflexi bacterium]|nr:hypothetical protein [Chloroflexota bacterium]MBI3931544.1 hypothetical protein [Chloroflexota bacterium]